MSQAYFLDRLNWIKWIRIEWVELNGLQLIRISSDSNKQQRQRCVCSAGTSLFGTVFQTLTALSLSHPLTAPLIYTRYCSRGRRRDNKRHIQNLSCLYTVCNRTYYARLGSTYRLSVVRPRLVGATPILPWHCWLNFTALGGHHGDRVLVSWNRFRNWFIPFASPHHSGNTILPSCMRTEVADDQYDVHHAACTCTYLAPWRVNDYTRGINSFSSADDPFHLDDPIYLGPFQRHQIKSITAVLSDYIEMFPRITAQSWSMGRNLARPIKDNR